MAHTFDQRLNLVSSADLISYLSQINRGIEKEGLRTTAQGELAQTPHPAKLGSALTHPSITTDYSEALLEFITPVFNTPEETINYLSDIHRYYYSQLDDEFIWATSMPCFLGGEDAIPIARYGSSNIGMLKHVYRIGLAYRYGKMMQTIAGIHYNFSLPETFWPNFQQSLEETGDLQSFQTDEYFALIRNFRRYSWLLLYLFGASPALCPSFLQGRSNSLKSLAGNTLYAPYGTSLRMGDLGYQNNAQQHLHVCYNSLDDYITTLGRAIHTPHAEYEAIGVKHNGQYRQLNTNVLQIENEYYSDIRPKRVTPSGQKPLHELSRNGVQYIEVRNLDINPFLPAGIDSAQARFVDCFLLYCLLEDSPIASDEECQALAQNKSLVVNRGREPNLFLARCNNRTQKLAAWGAELFDKIANIADIMDSATGDRNYLAAVAEQREKLENPDATPSSRVLQALNDQHISFFEFALQQTKIQGDYFKSQPLPASTLDYFTQLAQDSRQQQSEIEANDQMSFDEYLRQYLAS